MRNKNKNDYIIIARSDVNAVCKKGRHPKLEYIELQLTSLNCNTQNVCDVDCARKQNATKINKKTE